MPLNINEIFYTIQGEGPLIGKPSIFIRLTGCNLRCYWCDTAYTWLFSENIAGQIRQKLGDQADNIVLNVFDREEETHRMEIDEILDQISKYSGDHIVISGGEPLLQAKELVNLTKKLLELDYSIEIETNGTKSPVILPDGIRYNVSPKLENSFNDKDKRYIPEIIDQFLEEDAIFKFVITSANDLGEVEEIIQAHNIPNQKIYLMPEGRSSDELKEKSSWLIDICKERNYSYTHRLHIDLFDKSRGV